MKYKLTKYISKGTFGQVFLAKDENDVLFAIKKISKKKTKKKEFEIELTALILISKYCQEYTVCYKEQFQDNDNYYIVMDYLQGPSLKNFILCSTSAERLKIDPDSKTIKHLINGLNKLFSMGVANQDIKLENIMYANLSQDIYKPRIIDWGLACFKHTKSNCDIFGTLYTVPPEIHEHNIPLRVEKPFQYAMAHDIWSMGIVAYSWYILNKETATQYYVEKTEPPVQYSLNVKSPFNMTQVEIDNNIDKLIPDKFGNRLCKMLLTKDIQVRLKYFNNVIKLCEN